MVTLQDDSPAGRAQYTLRTSRKLVSEVRELAPYYGITPNQLLAEAAGTEVGRLWALPALADVRDLRGRIRSGHGPQDHSMHVVRGF